MAFQAICSLTRKAEKDAERIAIHIQKKFSLKDSAQWIGGPRGKDSDPLKGFGRLQHSDTISHSQSVAETLANAGIELSKKQGNRLRPFANLSELFDSLSIKGLRYDSHMGILGWLKGRYQLVLIEHVPTPQQMLDIQCQGQRYVSLLPDSWANSATLGRHKSAFEFLLHDLEHAHKFFGDSISHLGQRQFFRYLRASIPELIEFASPSNVAEQLNCLMADMNSHPVHLFKYLKATILQALKEAEGTVRINMNEFWRYLLCERWEMNGLTLQSALHINEPGFEAEVDRELLFQHFLKPPALNGQEFESRKKLHFVVKRAKSTGGCSLQSQDLKQCHIASDS